MRVETICDAAFRPNPLRVLYRLAPAGPVCPMCPGHGQRTSRATARPGVPGFARYSARFGRPARQPADNERTRGALSRNQRRVFAEAAVCSVDGTGLKLRELLCLVLVRFYAPEERFLRCDHHN